MDKIVSVLWHMHQPCYKDANGEYIMPWVFTHSIKDYYDMPYLAVKNGVKVTFNLVPSLIVQVKEYANFNVNDRFLNYIKKKERNEYENKFVLNIIKSTSFALINRFRRFEELLSLKHLNDNDMNDIEVFFLLAHCGSYLRQNNEIVKELINKSSFAWEEKIILLKELHKFIGSIIPFYRSSFKEGKIDISTTPFYHPILPLLLDVNAAENLKKPKVFADFKDDAVLQVKSAIELFEKEFGKKPSGMWPAEGGVSQKTVELFNEFDIKWIATDESVLYKTNPSYKLDKKYSYKGVNLIFRDKTISDNIGFKYQFLKTDDAVKDLRNSLKDINVIIMDGENAWEYYSDPNGFLDAFYREIKQFNCMSISELSEYKNIETVELGTIANGSWINADFSIWIGDDEKNRAWELLSKVKMNLDEQKDAESEKLLLTDEGSDWFWWYGNTNYSKHKGLYDYIFKSRIAKIYKKLNKPLDDIYSLIIESEEENRPPISYIRPDLDGEEAFFEYINAGEVTFKSSAIHIQPVIDKIKYGYDENKNLYLAIFLKEHKNITLMINSKKYEIKKGIYEDYAFDKIIEIKLPFCDKVDIEVIKDGKSEQKLAFDVKNIELVWVV